jgi:hypothetical protein
LTISGRFISASVTRSDRSLSTSIAVAPLLTSNGAISTFRWREMRAKM